MKLSGVDPGIIRELSGIYKPFVKAFKELISNSYDADAKKIAIRLAPDFQHLEVSDDGIGMTPFHFYQDFARLGGSTAWLQGGESPSGRPRIGYKGIGFLAVARYCRQLHIETHAKRPFRTDHVVRAGSRRKALELRELLPQLSSYSPSARQIRVRDVYATRSGREVRLKRGRHYVVTEKELRLLGETHRAELRIVVEVGCRDVSLSAVIDFDHLLSLEHRADLGSLDSFCEVQVKPAKPDTASFTRVRLHSLKDFVVRELSSPPIKGKARNIAFKSGKDQFLWRLSRSCPIRTNHPAGRLPAALETVRREEQQQDLPDITVQWKDDAPVTLVRPTYDPPGSDESLGDSVVPIQINEGGLRAVGYLLARSEVIYPAEFRGVSIRVRNVTIGDASFLGWENIASGPRKAALSQVTGELMVLSGLDAADAINPGRESFYEENDHFRILKRNLVGSEETLGGLVGQAVRLILDRIRVRSQVTDRLLEARQRRKALSDIASAVNYYSRTDSSTATDLVRFFEAPLGPNGLSSAREFQMRPSHKIGGFELDTTPGLDGDFEIDFKARRVRFDFTKDSWDTSLYLNGHFYKVHFKQGRPDQPICEFDNQKRHIYVNWTHPVKLHMDDLAFLKSAILLRLAHHASSGNGEAMMDLALNMLAFRAE